MRRTLSVTLLASLAILAAACAKGSAAGEAPAAEAPTSVENPCAQPKAGEAASCAEGCKWNGSECRQERGIIVND